MRLLRCARNDVKNKNMLSIKILHAGISGKEIIKGFNLEVKAGEVHAIMGPNGSGKALYQTYWQEKKSMW